MFYQLPEATEISWIKSEVSFLLSHLDSEFASQGYEQASIGDIKTLCGGYVDAFSSSVYSKKLNGSVLRKVIGKVAYENLLEVGKKASEK